MQNFAIGDIFAGSYPADAACWCQKNKATIVELAPVEGARYFQIAAIPRPTETESKNIRIAELQRFLSSTDWYAIRYADVGVEIPAEIKEQRAAARSEIDALREELARADCGYVSARMDSGEFL